MNAFTGLLGAFLAKFMFYSRCCHDGFMKQRDEPTTWTAQPSVFWYARCDGIAMMGPFKSQLEATSAIRGHDGLPVKDAFVWPEQRRLPDITKGFLKP